MRKSLTSWILDHEGLVILLLVLVVLRIPNLFEPYWYGDEGIYLTIGQAMRRGAVLYREIVDHKTPLIYLIAAVVQTQFWFRVWLIVSSLISTILFYWISVTFFSKRWVVLLATSLFTILTTFPWLEGNIANGELLLMPFVLAGVGIFWHASKTKMNEPKKVGTYFQTLARWWPFLVGAFFGLAVLLKVPALLDFGALGVWLVLFLLPLQNTRLRMKGVGRYTFWLGGGFVVMIALSLIGFWLAHALTDYIHMGLLYNFLYVQVWDVPFSHPTAVFFSTLLGRLLLLIGWIGLLFAFRRQLPATLLFTLLWFGFSLLGATLSLRPYPHYFIQVVPAAVLLIGFMGDARNRLGTIFSLGSLLVSLGIWWGLGFYVYPTFSYYQRTARYLTGSLDQYHYYESFDHLVPHIYEAATWLQERTQRNEPVFIWGNVPSLYALAQRSPVGKFTVAFHIESFQAHEETLRVLKEEKPRIIIWQDQAPSWDALEQVVHFDYAPGPSFGPLHIYQRIPTE